MKSLWNKYLGSSISSIENDVSICLAKAGTAIGSLLIVRKSDFFDKINGISSKLFLRHTIIFTFRLEANETIQEKIDGYYTRRLCAVWNKCWKQYPSVVSCSMPFEE